MLPAGACAVLGFALGFAMVGAGFPPSVDCAAAGAGLVSVTSELGGDFAVIEAVVGCMMDGRNLSGERYQKMI